MTDRHSPGALNQVSLKWRDLAERRHAYFVELYQSGRWRHYYTEVEILDELRGAFGIARRWAKLAPRPEDAARSAG